jgi:hypothetical protein
MALEERPERGGVAEAPDLGLAERPLEPLGRKHGGEVEERARDGGHGDALVLGDLVLAQASTVEELDAQATVSAPRARHVDPGARGLEDAPEVRRRTVGEDRSGPGGQYGGHPPAATRETAVSDRIHAPVDGQEAAALEPVADRPAAEPEILQLPAGDHPVLALRERAEGAVVIDTCSLSPCYGLELQLVRHRTKLGRRRRTGGLRALRARDGWVTGRNRATSPGR